MLEKLISNDRFCEKMYENTRDIVSLMLDGGVEFGVICSTKEVVFDPPLPDDIRKNIKPIALFVLSNYSFKSAYLSEDRSVLFFEAGFGPDNYPSLVGIDISNIIQIVVEDTPVFINVCAGKQKAKKKPAQEPKEAPSIERSMEKLLSRPENKKFLK